MKKKHLFLLATVAMISLSGCTKDKPKETAPPTLEVIEPETSETISDKLDDPSAPDLEVETVPEAIYIIDGRQMNESEYSAYEESLQANEEKPTDADGNNIPGGFSNPLVETELSEDGSVASYKVNETVADQTEPESLSEEQVEELESNINDFTYKQAVENQRIACKYDLAELRKSNPEFADITDEMVDNYSEDELDALVQRIMKAKGY